jgi:1,5-anhydro-D-fructose reductase (1,5-anhydro-D-mannitol-forming)
MIPAINAQPDSHVVAVMSRSIERARRYAAKNGIPRAYDDLAKLLADPDVDAVFIGTTNERHCADAIAAATAGKHVFCEKPLALTIADARAMVDACDRAGLVMATNHHLRSADTIRTIRELIVGGTIGRPLAARVFHAVYLPPHLQTWRIKEPANGPGVILDLTVHDADTLRFLLDDEVEDVTAMSARQGLAERGIEDAVMGVMQFRTGVLAQFHDAFTIKHAATGLEIHGTEGSILADGVISQQPLGQIMLRRNASLEPVSVALREDPYGNAVRHFNQAVRGAGQPFATGDDGLRSLAVALAVKESTQTGGRVAVRYA